jgi:SAM-dependent methyltransferase
VSDDAARAVRGHYEAVGDLYRAAWGDELHFVPFAPGQDRHGALAELERRLVDRVGMTSGDSVLDVGCGTGAVALAVVGRCGARVTGIDLVPGHVASARAEAARRGLEHRATFVEADATAMPFPDASFDHVYAIESAYHAADKPRFYAECARVLRPGGCFVGTDWLRGADSDDGLVARVEAHFAIPQLLTLAELHDRLADAGLAVAAVGDLADLGDVRPNWDALDTSAWPRLMRAAREAPPGAFRTFTAGARTLAEAAAGGAFLIGYWRARKPAPGTTG